MNSNTYKNLFIKIFCITLLVKIFLAYFTPMTGDEAFFYQWGVFPAAGYSDHPPMVGWLIFLLRMLGEHPLILRAFTVLLTSIIGLGIVLLCQKTLDQKYQAHAWLIGALYLCLPWSWLFFMVTTDTTLVLFMFCSGLVYMLADRQASASKALVLYALCGILLGLAFLSKYFSALLGFAFAIHCLIFRRKRLWAPFVILAFALPAICFNLWFNATHGWSNIMFNVFNRNQDKQWSIGTLIGYIAMVVYIITPWTIFYAFKSKKTFATDKKLVYSALTLWSVPFALFLVLSIKRSIGLHWVIGFVPFFMIWAAYRLHTEHLQKSIKWMASSWPTHTAPQQPLPSITRHMYRFLGKASSTPDRMTRSLTSRILRARPFASTRAGSKIMISTRHISMKYSLKPCRWMVSISILLMAPTSISKSTGIPC